MYKKRGELIIRKTHIAEKSEPPIRQATERIYPNSSNQHKTENAFECFSLDFNVEDGRNCAKKQLTIYMVARKKIIYIMSKRNITLCLNVNYALCSQNPLP